MAKDKKQKTPVAADTGLAALCDKLIYWLLVLTVFIIPLLFNIQSYDQFEMPKLTALRILTSIMLGLWAIKIFEKGRIEWIPTPLDIPMLALAGFNILTTFTSFAPQLSFRGEYENFAGSLSNINYIVLYYIATQNLKDRKQIFSINGSLLFSGLLTGIYAMAQYSGHDIVQWNSDSMIQGRYFASMGNPNFLGALLIMMIPLNIAYFLNSLKEKKFMSAGLFAALFILLYIALFGTQSRGPFLGFVFSIIVFLVYESYKAYSDVEKGLENRSFANVLSCLLVKYRKWIAAIIAVLLVSAVLSATLGRSATKRLWDSITNIQGSFKQSRLHIWLPSLKIIRENPWLGTGVDTYKTVFPKYEGTNFANIDGANVSSRTAHDEPLNIAATMGLPALGVYFLLLSAYIRMWIKSFRRIEEYNFRMLSLSMFSAFVAYFVQNLFSFGVCAINITLYLFFAMHFMNYNEYYPAGKKAVLLYDPAQGNGGIFKGLLQAASAAIVVLLIVKAYSIFDADTHYNRGKIMGSVYNKWDLAIPEHIKSVQEEPGEVKYHVYLGLAYERYAMGLTDKDKQLMAVNSAINEYKAGVTLNKGNAYYWGNLGRAYALLAQLNNSGQDFEQAVSYYETAIEKAPVTGLFYNNLIDLYLKTGMTDRAMPLLAKLEQYDKALAAGANFGLGNIFFTKKDFNNAEISYKKAIELDPALFQAYHNLGVVYAARRDRVNAKIYLEKFIELAPASEMVPNAKKILNELK
jgi:O-antigen ligase